MSFLARDSMAKNSLDRWAEELTKEVYDKWKSKYRSKSGFKIFYSPVFSKPNLMIITLNPGGTPKHFRRENLTNFENGNFTVPEKNEYSITGYTMAKKLRKFFENHMSLLDTSVAFPILFFRSKNVKSWKKINKNQRKEMEEFCYGKVKEIMVTIRPRFLLVLGLETYKKLKKHILYDVKNEKKILGKKKRGKNPRNIAYYSEWNGIPVFSMMHPTGARISNYDFEELKKLFFGMFADHFSGKQTSS